MGEEIAFENGQISDFQGLVTLILTLDRVILHTLMHQASISTYIPNFVKIEETFRGRLLTANFKVSSHKNSDKNHKSGPDKL